MGRWVAPAQADRSQQRHPQGQFDGRSDPGRNAVVHLHCLPEGTTAWCEARNVKAQRQLVRGRLGVAHDPQRARAVAVAGIRSAAEVMNNPPDLINVALELLVKASLELPAFSTLDEIASRVRREVNAGMFERVAGRIGLPDRVGLESLLEVVGPAVKTPFNWLKQPAGKASWSGFREQVEHLRWVDSLGDTDAIRLQNISARSSSRRTATHLNSRAVLAGLDLVRLCLQRTPTALPLPVTWCDRRNAARELPVAPLSV